MYIKDLGFLSQYCICENYRFSSHFIDCFIPFPFAPNGHVFQRLDKRVELVSSLEKASPYKKDKPQKNRHSTSDVFVSKSLGMMAKSNL